MISDIVSTTSSFLQGDVQTVCINRKKHVVVIETAILRQSICHSRAKHAKLSRFFLAGPMWGNDASDSLVNMQLASQNHFSAQMGAYWVYDAYV